MMLVISFDFRINISLFCVGMVPMEGRHLQKVDTVIFGHDKFAFEMVHFVKSAGDNLNKRDKSVAAQWEVNFLFGLESLLVECAVINDDIERDCFVSRVYCWFTEKLVERRELPRQGNNRLQFYYLERSAPH